MYKGIVFAGDADCSQKMAEARSAAEGDDDYGGYYVNSQRVPRAEGQDGVSRATQLKRA